MHPLFRGVILKPPLPPPLTLTLTWIPPPRQVDARSSTDACVSWQKVQG